MWNGHPATGQRGDADAPMSSTYRRGARAAIHGQGAGAVEEHVGRMLTRGLGRGKSVAAGFGSLLSKRKWRKGGDDSEGEMDSKVKDE